jgi:hypothetical protein
MTSQSFLALIALCAVLGATGQLARTVVGLKKLADQAANTATSFSQSFEPSRFVVSVIIGAVAGVVGGLSLGAGGFPADHLHFALGVVAAGYAGTDFIEGFMSRELPTPAAAAGRTTDVPPAGQTSGSGRAGARASPREAPPALYTVHHGRRYRATITLTGFLEPLASNEMIVERLTQIGFDHVVVSGSGPVREAVGRWTGQDTTAQLDPRLSHVVELDDRAQAA